MTTIPNQYTSPSYAFAQHVVTTLGPEVQRSRQQGRSESATIRCVTRIKAQLLEDCEKILERSNTLRTEFNKIANPMTDLEHLRVLRQYEGQLYRRIEVEGSLGWNYLDDENWEILGEELKRVFAKGSSLKLVSHTIARLLRTSTHNTFCRYRRGVLLISPQRSGSIRFGKESTQNRLVSTSFCHKRQVTNVSR
jgi:hypothetical protein